MNAKQLHDILSRTVSVIETSEGADEHHELLGELRTLVDDCAMCAHCDGAIHFEDGNPLPSEQPVWPGLES